MRVTFIFVGKTTEPFLQSGFNFYLKRLNHYLKTEVMEIPSSSASEPQEIQKVKKSEGEKVLKKITAKDYVILLDEKGKQFSSVELAEQLELMMVRSVSHVVFVTGGAFGVSEEIKSRANLILSFSKMTFTHQMIRVMLAEQLYRAMTILKNESYHHE